MVQTATYASMYGSPSGRGGPSWGGGGPCSAGSVSCLSFQSKVVKQEHLLLLLAVKEHGALVTFAKCCIQSSLQRTIELTRKRSMDGLQAFHPTMCNHQSLLSWGCSSSLGCVEDEQHLIFDCSAYDHIRVKHVNLVHYCCTVADFLSLFESNVCGGFS